MLMTTRGKVKSKKGDNQERQRLKVNLSGEAAGGRCVQGQRKKAGKTTQSRCILNAECGPGPRGGTGAPGWIAAVQPRSPPSVARDWRCAAATERSGLERPARIMDPTHLDLNSLYTGLLYLRIRIRPLET
ncbi:uncharacterized protein GJ701_006716 isoform 1-T1 [Geothlypis trichas]